MGNLLAYSGIAAKVRAMESHFLKETDFQDMASLPNVREAQEFLKRFPAYEELFSHSDGELHRGDIEKLLSLSALRDFQKLYLFASPDQRRFLKLYFINFEILILKKCLRHIWGSKDSPLDLSAFQDFFSSHSRLDPLSLASSESVSQLTENLKGSVYYELFKNLENDEGAALFDYEMQLDLYHFRFVWQHRNKFFSSEEQKVITQCLGSKMDLLNIQWIYRSKRYYHLDASSIVPLLIPIRYRLKQEDIQSLSQAATVEELFNLLTFTYYGNLTSTDLSDHPDLEAMYRDVLGKIYSRTRRRYPYSAAVLNSYFYFKNVEVHRIITTIESIRYGVNPGTIASYSIIK